MFFQSLTTRTSQYKKSARNTVPRQDSLRAIHIIIAIRRAVVANRKQKELFIHTPITETDIFGGAFCFLSR